MIVNLSVTACSNTSQTLHFWQLLFVFPRLLFINLLLVFIEPLLIFDKPLLVFVEPFLIALVIIYSLNTGFFIPRGIDNRIHLIYHSFIIIILLQNSSFSLVLITKERDTIKCTDFSSYFEHSRRCILWVGKQYLA